MVSITAPCSTLSPEATRTVCTLPERGALEFDVATERWKDYLDPDGEMEIDLFRDDGIIHVITTAVDRRSRAREPLSSGRPKVGSELGMSPMTAMRRISRMQFCKTASRRKN